MGYHHGRLSSWRMMLFVTLAGVLALQPHTIHAAAESSKTEEEPIITSHVDDDFDVSNEDWGTYYDPKNIFCGPYDCYKILGFDYETFGKPATKQITQRYRKLSRAWHPDKSKFPNAKERFVQISRAYEVLTHTSTRKEYDTLRYDQDAYFKKYGSSVLWSYAPKTDSTLVILILLMVMNVVSWYSQLHRYNLVANRFIQAATEDWSMREGGSTESQLLRAQAMELLAQEQLKKATEEATNGTTVPTKKSKAKLSAKDRKRQEQDLLRPIVRKLVHKMDDFGAGFHKPSYRDLIAYKCIATWPIAIVSGVSWQMGYWVRRMRGVQLNDEERAVLTERSVGYIVWESAEEEERESLLKRELWISENFKEWSEEQEIKKLPAAAQKHYNKMKKKGKVE